MLTATLFKPMQMTVNAFMRAMARTINMNNLRRLILLGLFFLVGAYGCGSSLPPGTQKIGHYEGTFSSVPLSGPCQADLYRLPDGSGTFEGNFQGMEEDVFLTFRGQMTANRLDGTVFGEDVFGGSTITGVLSPDETEVNGTFSLNAPYSPNGTWNARRK